MSGRGRVLSKVGRRTAFIGKVGEDIFGGRLKNVLEEVGIDVSNLVIDREARRGGALISFDPNLRPPLWKSLEDAREQAAYGFSRCDILKISDNELWWFTGEEDYDAGIRKLRSSYDIPLILLSMGREGSRAYYRHLRIVVAPFLQASTVETTGAGDVCGGDQGAYGHAVSLL
ncbi:MAG: PfkB family carbohydrate kinase [Muribaculum sp.]|nr:PfkB family carbohydrate kinase [Muribaculum sp.]